jgi:asparagine synthase (glutamine-hydrolysing)
LGCVDPLGRWRERLGEWANDWGAARLFDLGIFGAWIWPETDSGERLIKTKDVCGLLQGDLFGASYSRASASSFEDYISGLFLQGGETSITELTGQFSIILWDHRNRRAMLYRDDTGAYPLYYAPLPTQGMIFSDRLDLLAGTPLVEKRLCRASLHEYLRFLDVSAPNTIYDGVYATRPGVVLQYDGRHLAEIPSESEPVNGAKQESLERSADELDARLEQAVASRMSSNGATAVFLSGGVDSSLICAFAKSTSAGPVEAVTLGYQEEEYDESRVASAVAKHLGVRHRVLRYPLGTYRSTFEELTSCIEYPYADPTGLPTLPTFRAAREIAEVSLDGTGADSLLGVMPARHQRFAVEYGTLLPRPLRALAAKCIDAVPSMRSYAALVDFDDPEEVLIRWRGWKRKEIERLCGEPVSLRHTNYYRVYGSFPRAAHLQRYSALIGSLPDDRIHQAAMLTGLKVRFPYFDKGVVAYVRSMSDDIRYRAEEPKRVLKRVLARRVPRRLWDVPKHGFDFPFLELMKSNDCALVRTYLDPRLTDKWSLFEPRALADAADAFLGGDETSPFEARSLAFRIWALVILFAWLENHLRHL